MATNFKFSNNDINVLFKTYSSGTKTSATNFISITTDLQNKYEIYDTSYVKQNITGFYVGINDISELLSCNYVDFTSSTNYTIPPNVIGIKLIALGGGGGGGGGGGSSGTGSGNNSPAQGGGGGGSSFPIFTDLPNIKGGYVINITIGSGGSAGSPSSNSTGTVYNGGGGGPGGNTYITYNSIKYGESTGGGGGGGGGYCTQTFYNKQINGGLAGGPGGTNGSDGPNTRSGGNGGVYTLTNATFRYSNSNKYLNYGRGNNGGAGGVRGSLAAGPGNTGYSGFARIYLLY
jgi:hypothetical protein